MYGVGLRNDLNFQVLEGRLQEARQKMESAKADPSRDKQVKEATRQFESYLLEYLLNTMQKTVDAWRDDNSSSRDVYYSMMYRNFADILSQSGRFGLASMLQSQLASKETVTDPSAVTPPDGPLPLAPSGPGGPLPLAPRPIPLPSSGGTGELPEGCVQPVECDRISSRFGMRSDPFTGLPKFHKGMDYAVPVGRSVRSVQDGVVEWSGYRGTMGNTVIVRHTNGLNTVYGHLSAIAAAVGDTVKGGQEIGLSGNTGRSTGPHLHFEIRDNGAAYDPEKLTELFSRSPEIRR